MKTLTDDEIVYQLTTPTKEQVADAMKELMAWKNVSQLEANIIRAHIAHLEAENDELGAKLTSVSMSLNYKSSGDHEKAMELQDLRAEVPELRNMLDKLNAEIARKDEALQGALVVIEDYLSYEHNGDPWTEDARSMGEMAIDEYGRNGGLEKAKAALAPAEPEKCLICGGDTTYMEYVVGTGEWEKCHNCNGTGYAVRKSGE